MDAFLTNEGGGPAFNARFGVEFHGIRYPYKLQLGDPDSGNIHRVVQVRDHLPKEGVLQILIDSEAMWGIAGTDGDPDSTSTYWARYENAQGKVWETSNPHDRSTKLDIRRVRFPCIREWREERKRKRAGKRGDEWLKKALAELQANQKESGA